MKKEDDSQGQILSNQPAHCNSFPPIAIPKLAMQKRKDRWISFAAATHYARHRAQLLYLVFFTPSLSFSLSFAHLPPAKKTINSSDTDAYPSPCPTHASTECHSWITKEMRMQKGENQGAKCFLYPQYRSSANSPLCPPTGYPALFACLSAPSRLPRRYRLPSIDSGPPRLRCKDDYHSSGNNKTMV
jgi:hypothetical protein